MPPDLTPESIRAWTFETARRGYDRGAVDRFKEEVADRVGELDTRLQTLEERLGQLGIADLPRLDEEFRRLGSDISGLLEEATRAAAEMRERAAADAATWVRDAEEDAEARRRRGREDAERMRGDAWAIAEQLLTDAADQAEAIVASAKQDALLTRGEAEREALRMTTDARRESEAVSRNAHTESERMMREAGSESDRLVEEARRSAETAQERARALELRRDELFVEVEAARRSLDDVERQLDQRREALHREPPPPDRGEAGAPATGLPTSPALEPDAGPEPPPAAPDREPTGSPGSSGEEPSPVEPEPSPGYGTAAWPDEEDDGSVRIVPADRAVPPGPVDADELIAEIERIRSGPQDEPDPETPTPVEPPPAGESEPHPEAVTATEPPDPGAETAPGPEVEERTPPPAVEPPEPVEDPGRSPGMEQATGASDEPAVESPTETPVETTTETQDETTERTSLPSAETTPGEDADHRPPSQPGPGGGGEERPAAVAEPDEASDADEPAPDPDAEQTGDGGPLDDLFASLRSTAGAGDDTELPPPDDGDAPPAPPGGDTTTVGPAPEEGAPPPARAGHGGHHPDPAVDVATAVELRDRLLLPVENRWLREVKRRMVDLQNRALDDLRSEEHPWSPDAVGYAAEMDGPLEALVAEAGTAGYRAAGDLAGGHPIDPPGVAVDPPVDHSGFAEALVEAVGGAHDRVAIDDAGTREVSAAVSRVFRAWRTDEAERRVRQIAHAAYHRGLLAGLAAAGVSTVTTTTVGRRCAQCPTVSGVVWDPADDDPPGVVVPPAHVDCAAIVVPLPPGD